MISPSVIAIGQSEIRRPSGRYGRSTLSSGIVARINAGSAEPGATIIVFSGHSGDSRWIKAETSDLTYARIKGQRILVPIVRGDARFVPPPLGLCACLPIRSRP